MILLFLPLNHYFVFLTPTTFVSVLFAFSYWLLCVSCVLRAVCTVSPSGSRHHPQHLVLASLYSTALKHRNLSVSASVVQIIQITLFPVCPRTGSLDSRCTIPLNYLYPHQSKQRTFDAYEFVEWLCMYCRQVCCCPLLSR